MSLDITHNEKQSVVVIHVQSTSDHIWNEYDTLPNTPRHISNFI